MKFIVSKHLIACMHTHSHAHNHPSLSLSLTLSLNLTLTLSQTISQPISQFPSLSPLRLPLPLARSLCLPPPRKHPPPLPRIRPISSSRLARRWRSRRSDPSRRPSRRGSSSQPRASRPAARPRPFLDFALQDSKVFVNLKKPKDIRWTMLQQMWYAMWVAALIGLLVLLSLLQAVGYFK